MHLKLDFKYRENHFKNIKKINMNKKHKTLDKKLRKGFEKHINFKKRYL